MGLCENDHWVVQVLKAKSDLQAGVVLVLWAVLVSSLLMAGCGFKLRGSRLDVQSLPSIYVSSERGTHLSIELHRVFHRSGVMLVDEREQADWWLTLSDEKRERRVLSVGSRGKVQEYELHYSLYYRLEAENGIAILDQHGLSLLRDFSFSGSDVLAKADEEELLYQGMERQASQMILWHLLSLNQNKDQQQNRSEGDDDVTREHLNDQLNEVKQR